LYNSNLNIIYKMNFNSFRMGIKKGMADARRIGLKSLATGSNVLRIGQKVNNTVNSVANTGLDVIGTANSVLDTAIPIIDFFSSSKANTLKKLKSGLGLGSEVLREAKGISGSVGQLMNVGRNVIRDSRQSIEKPSEIVANFHHGVKSFGEGRRVVDNILKRGKKDVDLYNRINQFIV